MLEDDAEPWEAFMKRHQMGKKCCLSIEDMSICGRIRRHFAMQIKNHIDLLHGFEYRIVGFVRLNTSVGVGGNASRVGFHT